MSEPDFIVQRDTYPNRKQCENWLKAEMRKGKAQGATWHRGTISFSLPVMLYEGWKVKPDDMGTPRFKMPGAT